MDILVNKILKTLKRRKQTVSFAESCTGGLLSGRLTNTAGVSAIFRGTIVSYDNLIKTELLKVSTRFLKTHGAVSPEVALKMAWGAQQVLKSKWSVSITGVAGPGGGTKSKPVGTVCFAVVGPNFERTQTCFFKGNRKTIRAKSVKFALEFLLKSLSV